MRRVDHRMSALMLLVWPLLGMAQTETAQPAEVGQQALAESFEQLVFGFCSTIVSQDGTPKLDRVPPSVTLRGPIPLSETGSLSAPLQKVFQAKPETMVYAATTSAAGVGHFQMAYAMADGSACIALAQDMPAVVARVSTRVDADPQYRLRAEGEARRIFKGVVAGGESAIEIALPASVKASGIEDVRLRRLPEEPATLVSVADLQAWSRAVFQTCLKSAQQKTAVSVSSFGEFMTERPARDGKKAIVSPPRYPTVMLFVESGPRTGCRVLLSAGVEENAQVAALWRDELSKLSAKLRPSKKGEEFLVARVRGDQPAAGVRCQMAEVASGVFSVTILTE